MIRTFFLLFFIIQHCVCAASKVCWTQEQDTQLLDSIQKQAGNNWSAIAEEVFGKTSKQCRERYLCHLDPMIDKSPLSDAEISTLDLAVQELGTNWSEISKTLFTLPDGKRRTDLQLKNVWHSQHRSVVGERKSTASHKRHLEDAPTTLPQQFYPTVSLITTSSAKKEKKVTESTITDTIFVAQPLYSAISLDSTHLLPAHPLLVSGKPHLPPSLLMLSSNVTHSESVAPYTPPLQLLSNSVRALQPSTDIAVDVILGGPELTTVFEEDNSFCEDAFLLREFNIRTRNQDD
jgi:hypothetical protein